MQNNQKILNGVLKITEQLTNTYPQIEEGINGPKYVIIGSMARMLLSQADYCIDDEGNRIEIPLISKKILNNSVRKIGDIDILSFHEQGILFGKDRLQFWSQNRPCLKDISKESCECIKEPNSSSKIEIQPSVLYQKKSYVTININKKDYYVQGLDLLLAYNTLFIIRSYNLFNDKIDRQKCENDFKILFEACKQMYDIETLKIQTYNLLCFYKEMIRSENLTSSLVQLLDDGNIKAYIKSFVKDILKDDIYKMFNIHISPEQNKSDGITINEIDRILTMKDVTRILSNEKESKSENKESRKSL